jgi:hypothetical protein
MLSPSPLLQDLPQFFHLMIQSNACSIHTNLHHIDYQTTSQTNHLKIHKHVHLRFDSQWIHKFHSISIRFTSRNEELIVFVRIYSKFLCVWLHRCGCASIHFVYKICTRVRGQIKHVKNIGDTNFTWKTLMGKKAQSTEGKLHYIKMSYIAWD